MDDGNGNKANGRTLHREFVGMLFALATAEVAVEASALVQSKMELYSLLPAISHLVLATAIVATSWVGWGRSESSLSDIKSVFSWDFVELLVDVWLVAVYFFIARGVELPPIEDGKATPITPSLLIEARWAAVMFLTYFLWDLVTKWPMNSDGERMLVQRGWASFACMGLGVLTYFWLPLEPGITLSQVIAGDISLLSLVFLFRAMKVQNFGQLRWIDWRRIAALLIAWGVALVVACGFLEGWWPKISN